MCPHCGQDSPIVYQGVAAFCSACGKPRLPLVTPSVSYAGKPSRAGGTVAGVAGWVVLAFGWSAALGIGLLLGTLFELGVALAFALPIALFTAVISVILNLSGRKLRQSGDDKLKETRRQAVLALARNRRGAVTANEAARALGVPPAVADAFLTDLAKTTPEDVTVEIDDKGGIYYAFPRLVPMGRQRFEQPHVRVEGAPETGGEGLEYDEGAQAQPPRRKQGL